MDYEKEYKEALERAREYHKVDKDNTLKIYAKGTMEYLFPVLKESEDERIRKGIISNLDNMIAYIEDSECSPKEKKFIINNIKKQKTWLEKQGEQKSEKVSDYIELSELEKLMLEKQGESKFEQCIQEGDKIVTNEDGTHFNVSQLERVAKKEPNPAWSEEDISNINYLLNALCGVIGLKQIQIDKLIKWLRSLKDRVQPQPKQEWSEEDERMHNASIRACQYIIDNFENSTKDYEDAIDWLNSLKDRVQPQNNTITSDELAKAKKEAYNDALDKIEYHSGDPSFGDGWDAAIWYIKKKNICFKNTWKPSKEQMKGIDCAIKTLRHQLNVEDKRLNSLYEQLKKL